MVKVKILRPCISNGVSYLAGDTPTLSDDEANILIMMNKASTDLNAKVIINLEPIFEQIGGVDEDSLKRAIIAQLDKLDLGGLSETEVSAKVNTLKNELNLLITKNKTDLAKLQSDLANLSLSGDGIDERRVVDIFYKSALANNLISFDFEAWKNSLSVIENNISTGQSFIFNLVQGGSYGAVLSEVKFYDETNTPYNISITEHTLMSAKFNLLKDNQVVASFTLSCDNNYGSRDYYVSNCLYGTTATYKYFMGNATGNSTLTFSLVSINDGIKISKLTFLPGVAGRYSKTINVNLDEKPLFSTSGLSFSTLCEVTTLRTQADVDRFLNEKYASCIPNKGE